MKSNQKGFSVIEILVVIVVIGLVGAIGWLVYDRQNSKTDSKEAMIIQAGQESNDNTYEQDTIQQTGGETEQNKKNVDTTVHEVDISLKSEADLSKLPDYTPVSFKNYLAEKLRSNKSYDNGEAIVTDAIIVSKISQVNIQGGQVPTDTIGNGYPGGAPAIWVITPAGTWDQESLNIPVCVSENGGKIYEEFVSTCYDDANPNGMKNPNGSIKSLSQ